MRRLLPAWISMAPLAFACASAEDTAATGDALNPGGAPVGAACVDHAECESDACDDTGVCVARRSCTGAVGGRTCGVGEDGALHEDCCSALPVDTVEGTVLLDEYLITAGRMRRFIERTGGDVRSFVAALDPEDPRWRPEWTASVPSNLAEANWALGPYDAGRSGCYFAGEGARTYWMSAEDNASFGGEIPHAYGPEVLDAKALNCVNFFLLQAFCIWDGGRLARADELEAAWGPASYPWGEDGLDADHVPSGFSHRFPEDALDRTAHIPAPGRYPLGQGPYGHQDLAGVLFQLTSTLDDGAGAIRWSNSGSWESHPAGAYPDFWGSIDAAYWAAGGRCVVLAQ